MYPEVKSFCNSLTKKTLDKNVVGCEKKPHVQINGKRNSRMKNN
jgi:hypothetical protein